MDVYHDNQMWDEVQVGRGGKMWDSEMMLVNDILVFNLSRNFKTSGLWDEERIWSQVWVLKAKNFPRPLQMTSYMQKPIRFALKIF